MNRPAAADLQRWSEEVARDPGSLAFVPLAESYRRQGRRDAALRVCLRGLDQHPSHVRAHALLGKLYLERGDRERAADEWSTVVRLDPESFEGHRGLGFTSLERDQFDLAERHLLRALEIRPGDATVTGALQLLRERRGDVPAPVSRVRRAASAAALRATRVPPVQSSIAAPPARVSAVPMRPPASVAPSGPGAEGVAPNGNGSGAVGAGSNGSGPAAQTPAARDPARLFATLEAEEPFRGAVVLDTQGLVIGGELAGNGAAEGHGDDATDELGAALGPVVEEAARTAGLLHLGAWHGLLLETAHATLHIDRLPGGFVVVLVTSRNAPAGWVIRMAGRARDIATTLVEDMQ